MPDNIEKILKQIHILFAKGEKSEESEDLVTVSKSQVFELLEKLNYAILGLMDDYEMTNIRKEQAMHKLETQGQKIMDEAAQSAEDIYAAAMMYTDDMLIEVRKLLRQTQENIQMEYNVATDRIDKQIKKVNSDRNELMLSLKELAYSKDYFEVIQKERKRKAEEERKAKEASAKASKTASGQIVAGGLETVVTPLEEEEFKKPEVVINVNMNHPSVIKANADKAKKEEEAKKAEMGLEDDIFNEEIEIDFGEEELDLGDVPPVQAFSSEELDSEFFEWQEEEAPKKK